MRICIIKGLCAPYNGHGLYDLKLRLEYKHRVDYCALSEFDPTVDYNAIIGHSLGAEKAIKYAKNHSYCKRLFLISPVRGAWFPFIFPALFKFEIPSSVGLTVAFYCKSIIPPETRVKKTEVLMEHWVAGTHSSICGNAFVHMSIESYLNWYPEET